MSDLKMEFMNNKDGVAVLKMDFPVLKDYKLSAHQ